MSCNTLTYHYALTLYFNFVFIILFNFSLQLWFILTLQSFWYIWPEISFLIRTYVKDSVSFQLPILQFSIGL